jgi:hypothetical protein
VNNITGGAKDPKAGASFAHNQSWKLLFVIFWWFKAGLFFVFKKYFKKNKFFYFLYFKLIFLYF